IPGEIHAVLWWSYSGPGKIRCARIGRVAGKRKGRGSDAGSARSEGQRERQALSRGYRDRKRNTAERILRVGHSGRRKSDTRSAGDQGSGLNLAGSDGYTSEISGYWSDGKLALDRA